MTDMRKIAGQFGLASQYLPIEGKAFLLRFGSLIVLNLNQFAGPIDDTFSCLDHREGLRVAERMRQLDPRPPMTSVQRAELLARFERLVREQQHAEAVASFDRGLDALPGLRRYEPG